MGEKLVINGHGDEREVRKPDIEVEFITPISQDVRTFQEYGTLFERRQQEREQSFIIPEHIEIKIHSDKPILLVPFGDIHAGGEEVDYKRVTREISQVANTSGVFAITLGDLTNSMFWGGAGQDHDIGSFGEQNNYMRAAVSILAKQKKLLASWAGDHDMWSTKTGESIYESFRMMGIHYLEGVSYISLWVGNELYKISGAHRHNGFSIYNKTHGAMRMYRDEGEGSDICITAHMHKKGINQQPVKSFGGDQTLIHLIAIGAYKRSDEYLRKKGYPRLKDEEMGAQSILLSPTEHDIQVFWDVEKGLKALENH